MMMLFSGHSSTSLERTSCIESLTEVSSSSVFDIILVFLRSSRSLDYCPIGALFLPNLDPSAQTCLNLQNFASGSSLHYSTAYLSRVKKIAALG